MIEPWIPAFAGMTEKIEIATLAFGKFAMTI